MKRGLVCGSGAPVLEEMMRPRPRGVGVDRMRRLRALAPDRRAADALLHVLDPDADLFFPRKISLLLVLLRLVSLLLLRILTLALRLPVTTFWGRKQPQGLEEFLS